MPKYNRPVTKSGRRSNSRSRLKSQHSNNQKYQYAYDSYKKIVNQHTDKRRELQRAEERAKAQAQRLKENRYGGGQGRRNRVSSAGINRRDQGYAYKPVWWG